jgi:PAS domain S-box-containing protein
MNQPLHCLLVEDDENEALLTLRELRAGGYDVIWERVETAAGMLEALARKPWDAIISDYKMPQFSGIAALELLRNSGHDLPFIIVSGTIGEDVAVAAMRAGAHDYLMKGKLARLVPVLEREQREARERRERKQAAAALAAERALLRTLVDHLPVAVYLKDSDGRKTLANPLDLHNFGLTEMSDLIGKTDFEFFPAAQAEAFYADDQRVIHSGQPVLNREEKLTRPDGSEVWNLTSKVPLHNSDGEVTGLVGIGLDITERKQAEAELHQLRKAVEQSANTIVITDLDGAIIYVNPAFEKNTGYCAAEAIGQNPRVLNSGRHDAAFYHHLWSTITAGKTWQGELNNRRKDGSLYWESATISPVFDEAGRMVRYIAIKEDITERKAMESNLREALARAESASVAKTEFLAIMSHELRTPLNGVLGFAELLSFTELDEEQAMYARTIAASGEHLLAVVNDVLDFSSIEKGTLSVQAAPFVLADLLAGAELACQHAAIEKGLLFRYETGPGVPTQLTGDERRLRQILINLLGNAIKFTASGSVVLRVDLAMEDNRHFLDFAVIDTGIGIAPATIGQLFQPFVQVNTGMNRQYGGTGLGLAISKRIAEAMGGSLTVVSVPQQGSTFTFRFPLDGFPLATEEDAASAGANELVLVVDDDSASRMLAGIVLAKLGRRAEFACDGGEAIAVFEPGKFSAILMDVAMPVIDGIEATARIRAAEVASGCRVPIIALTANVMPGDRERFLAAGMNEFVSKPFTRAGLAGAFERLAQGLSADSGA